MKLKDFYFIGQLLLLLSKVIAQNTLRKDISLNSNWLSIADEKNSHAYQNFQSVNFNVKMEKS